MDDTNINQLAPSVFLRTDPEEFFKHEPLKPTSDEIRLLTVHPELTRQGLVQCSLQHASLSSAKYTCLSYTWGKVTGMELIMVDGRQMMIRRMLFRFLQLARDRKYGLLWIDAVCINQKYHKERNHQVGLMGKIYSRAALVLAYLGRGQTRIELALDYLSNHESRVKYKSICARAIELVGSTPYCSRQWILQEVVLARSLIFLYGSSQCYRLTVERMADSLHHVQKIRPSTLRFLMLMCVEPGFVNPIQLMSSLYDGICSDPRDRIYAILGLVDNGDAFPVDYDCSVPALILRTAEFFGSRCQVDNDKTHSVMQKWTFNEYSRVLLAKFNEVLTDTEKASTEDQLSRMEKTLSSQR